MSVLMQRENGYWYIVYSHNSKQRWKSLKTKDKRVAKQIFNKLQVKLDTIKTGIAPRRLTISSAIETYLDAKQTTIKPRTFEQYKRQARTVLSLLKCEYCHKLTLLDLDNFISTRRKSGIAPKTIKEEIATIRAAMVHCRRSGLLDALPFEDWPQMKTAPVRPESIGYYSLSDIDKLKQWFKNRSFELIFLFALYTGTRRGEMEALKFSDLNLEEKTVRIRSSKTESNPSNQFRFIPLHKSLISALKSLSRGKRATDSVFPLLVSNYHNYPARVISIACKNAGVQYKRWHGIRHTTATYLLASGVPLRDVMQIMGWTRLETAQRYIHMANTAASQIAKLPF